MKSEKQIEDEFCRWVEEQGGKCLKLRIDGQNGFPDRTVLLNGQVTFIEFKKPGGKVSQKQWEWNDWLNANGFVCGILDNVEEAKCLVTGEWP